MNIYIGNLSYKTSEDTLKAMFADFGIVESAKVVKEGNTGLSKGYGFIEMPSNSDADQAIEGLNGKVIDGRYIKVKQANPSRKKSHKSPFRTGY